MSPIQGLSETVRLPRLGKIHLGYRDPNKNNAPVKTDYFVFPKEHSDYANLVKVFGEKPKELRVLIPVEDEEMWATQYYKAYNLTYGLVCKGDGETCTRMVDIKTKELPTKETKTTEMKELACEGKDCPLYKARKCGETMNLRFILPEVPGLGVWQIDTGSINSILNINSCAKLIKRTFGRITLIPLKLTLEPIDVNNPLTGKKQKVFVLNLRANVTMNQLADAAREQAKTLMIQAPDMEAAFDLEVEKTKDELWGEKKEVNRQTGEVIEGAVVPPTTPKTEPGQATQPPKEEKGSGTPEAKRDPSTIKSLNDLMKACHDDFGMQQADVLKELGKAKSEIVDPAKEYQTIAAVR